MLKEYRICMPMTVEEYHIGQLYMIARHSDEQSDETGEGVETIVNEPCEDENGKGQYAEKRIHLTSKLPLWIRRYIPKFLYITEKSWNYYPYTVTGEFICSVFSKFSLKIWTKYENNNGCNDNVHANTCSGETYTTDVIDIVSDLVRPHQYKENEDPSKVKSEKTGRGPLSTGWRDSTEPVMCSYKLVDVSFPVLGLQSLVEDFVHKEVRNINVIAHRQAVAWMDEWYGWTVEDVRAYEAKMQEDTNQKIRRGLNAQKLSVPVVDLDEEGNVQMLSFPTSPSASNSSGSSVPSTPSSAGVRQSGYLSSIFKWS